MNDQLLNVLKDMVLSFPEGKIILKEPVKVKKSPHQHLFLCFGVWPDQENELYVLDGAGNLHHEQVNVNYVITSATAGKISEPCAK